MFLAPENGHPAHHVYHAIHHNFTTKTPSLHTGFPKTTLKNTSKTALYAPRHHTQIFSEVQTGNF